MKIEITTDCPASPFQRAGMTRLEVRDEEHGELFKWLSPTQVITVTATSVVVDGHQEFPYIGDVEEA
jgi:hypothetical protein